MTQENINANEKKEPENKPARKTLEITQVQIFPFKVQSLGSIKALASITIEDQFVVRGLRVVDGSNGLFVGFPNDPFFKQEEGSTPEFRNLCFPITRELREHIENKVLAKYQAVMQAMYS